MTTSLMIPPVARFFDASGNPLASGKVYTYEAGTLTPKATYTDFTGDTENTNPVILDSSGEADIWLDGNYKINVTDADDVQQANYPVDNVSSFATGSLAEFVVATGSANNYILTPSPALTTYTAGIAYAVQINVTNTGPSTVNISGLGTISLVKGVSTALAAGDLVEDRIYGIIYDGTNFQVKPSGSMAWQYADDVAITGGSITDTSLPPDFINVMTAITTLETTDQIPFADDSDSDLNKKITVGNFLTTLAATTSQAGFSELADAAEVLTGTDSTRVPTPSALAGNKSLGASGYYKFPGGFTIQWGNVSVNVDSCTAVNFPTAFSNACVGGWANSTASPTGAGINIAAGCNTFTTTTMSVCNDGPTSTIYWVALGY